MPTSLTRLAFGCWLLAAVALAVLCPLEAQAASAQKQVLVLYSTRRDAQIVVIGDRELPVVVGNGLPETLDYYSEFIDSARAAPATYLAAFRDFLSLKYRNHRFDLVIAVGDTPLEFVERYRSGLFPKTPVVFFSESPAPRRFANSTGLSAPVNLRDTLDFALEMQPDLRNVFVVSGSEGVDKALTDAARAQLRPLESRLPITYLSGLPTKDLEARLATLPEHSAVYYLVVDQDGANQYFHPLDYLDRVVAVANAPVYCWVDSAMGHGIVGGSLKDQEAEMHAIGRLALRVLHGEAADAIPLASPDLNVRQVDWRQLGRWGISEARVPSDVLVKFRAPSTWDRYKIYILAALTALAAQTALIAGMLIQRARRKRAETQVRGNQAALHASFERIRTLGARLLHAQEDERSRIARELHDDISQQISVLAIDLELLGRAIQGRDDGLFDETLNRARSVAKSVHDLSHRLHPARLRLIGLVGALEGLQKELSQSDIAITFTHDNVPTTLPPDLTLCLFRIAQEALHNAFKYSRAGHVWVSLTGTADGLSLRVIDDGVGFDVDGSWAKGLGLISMDERVQAIGGTLAIRSTPGTGTRLEVAVPLAVEGGQDAATIAS